MIDAMNSNSPSTTVVESETKLVPALLSISKSTRALMGIKLAELDFHNGQDELLVALNEEAPIAVSKLADELHVRPSTVSKMLDRLVIKNLVERIGNPRDARRTMVRITPAGLDARSLLLNIWDKLEAELSSGLSGDAEEIIQTLDDVASKLEARISRLR
jgi:DNA-binding MarR family transcriptional regulator